MSVADTPRVFVDRGDSLSLLSLVFVLVNHLRLIVGITVGGGLLIIGYVWLTVYLPSTSPFNLLPNIYRAEAKVLLLNRVPSRASRLDLELAEAADSVRNLIIQNSIGQVGSSVMLAQELLAGRTIHDRIVDEFDFIGRYGLTDKGSDTRSGTSRSIVEVRILHGIVRTLRCVRRHGCGIRGSRTSAYA